MAKANPDLIAAIRRTALHLQKETPYQWGHMGSCNCGHLAQEITRLSKKEIHDRAIQSRSGDWNEQLIDYCPTSELPLDEVISEILAVGLDREDLMELEKLSNAAILKNLPNGRHHLEHNKRKDVILYLQLWAELLEKEWLEKRKKDQERRPRREPVSV